MSKKQLLLTTSLALSVSTALAAQETGRPGDASARFVSSRGAQVAAGTPQPFQPRDGDTVLYDQSASKGFAADAVFASNFTSSGFCCTGSIAADDFVIPGSGTHQITGVYAAGTISGGVPRSWTVTFYDKLKYDKQNGITTVVIKATCDSSDFNETAGDVLVNVSSCSLGTFDAGHHYSVSVEQNSGEEYGYVTWSWQTNRKQIGRQAFYFTYGGSAGPCKTQYTPIKTCFPDKGYGPDLAFAIYGK